MRRAWAIREFANELANTDPPGDSSENFYRCDVRLANLVRWLDRFDDVPGSAIFVGAEPGRHGAAMTGVPFVSTYMLTSGDDPWGEFGEGTDYAVPPSEKRDQTEHTATRFWRYIAPQLVGLPRPLIWNTYPFWPYNLTDDGNLENRGANPCEIEIGKPWLKRISAMFPGAQLVAAGKQAEKTLESMAFDPLKMPHPAARISNDKLIAAAKQVAAVLRSSIEQK